MGRSPCCSKKGVNRGAWTVVEDTILTEHIAAHGEGKWRHIPKQAGLNRCGKSCRLRWLNYLRPDIKRGNISTDEEDLIIRLHNLLGNRWALIAGRLPGLTDNEIKNYWNTNLRKRLQDRQEKSTPYHPDHSNKNKSPVAQLSIEVTPERTWGADAQWTPSFINGDTPENFMMDLSMDDDIQINFDLLGSCEGNHISSCDNIVDDNGNKSNTSLLSLPPPPSLPLSVPLMFDHQGGHYEMKDCWTLCDQNVGSNLNSFSPLLDSHEEGDWLQKVIDHFC